MNVISSIRSAALRVRVGLTRGQRQRAVDKLALAGAAPLSALFYHRVADVHPNDWTISRATFGSHVSYCRKHFDLISLAQLQERCAKATSFRPSVSFTFDDGYAENMDYAIPLLIQQKIPCTYFVTVENILSGGPFEHDVHQGRPLATNTIAQVREMADNGIEIGLHTRSHINFADVTCRKTLKREISDAGAELADLIGRPIRYFAFPFGLPAQLTQEAIETVYEAGMVGFCSAYGAYNLVGQDTFHIRRIHGDCDFSRLQNWLTFDQRKLLTQPQISYTLPKPMSRSPQISSVVSFAAEHLGVPTAYRSTDLI